MVLKLTVYISNVIFSLISQKTQTRWNFDILNFYSEISILAYMSLKIGYFWAMIMISITVELQQPKQIMWHVFVTM